MLSDANMFIQIGQRSPKLEYKLIFFSSILFSSIMEQNGTILQRQESTSSQCQFINDYKKRPSPLMGSWRSELTKFESLVGIFLIFLNLTLIGILFPMVTSNVSKLNKLVQKENDMGKTLKKSFIKQTNLIEKIDGINDKQIQYQIQLDVIDGMQVLTFIILKGPGPSKKGVTQIIQFFYPCHLLFT